jgi:hypothetical protein
MNGQRNAAKASASSRQRQKKRQHAPGRGVPGRRASRHGGKAARAGHRQLPPQQDAPASPLVLPAAAGLSLPKLTGIPTHYGVHTDVFEGARLALALLQAEIIDADDYEGGADSSSFIARSLTRLWVPEGIERFSLTYSFATVGEGSYFLINLDEGSYLDFAQPALVCDRAHEQLGPSLLTHLHAYTPLLPAFTPEVCREYIVCYHWEGWDEAENLLEMARCDLSYAQGVDEDSLSAEEVATYAESHYFTPRRVDSLIDRRYQNPGTLSLEACAELCRYHGFTNLTRVCELLGELRTLTAALPERAQELYEYIDGSRPFGMVVGLQQEGAEIDLVDEIYREHEQHAWQTGEFEPLYALELDPNDPDSFPTLKNALEACKRMLKLTQELYETLEVSTCLFP